MSTNAETRFFNYPQALLVQYLLGAPNLTFYLRCFLTQFSVGLNVGYCSSLILNRDSCWFSGDRLQMILTRSLVHHSEVCFRLNYSRHAVTARNPDRSVTASYLRAEASTTSATCHSTFRRAGVFELKPLLDRQRHGW